MIDWNLGERIGHTDAARQLLYHDYDSSSSVSLDMDQRKGEDSHMRPIESVPLAICRYALASTYGTGLLPIT